MPLTGLGGTLRCLLRGQTILRILMNRALAQERIRGRVVDVGGGHGPDYFAYLQTDGDVTIELVDGSISGIDFEKDPLPYESATADTVILCNVLEHVYSYEFLLCETRRILRPDGQLIGFVPFLIGYHPDPEDYFRYTRPALRRILTGVGFTDVTIRAIGGGPILAAFNTVVLWIPRLLRPVVYCVIAPFDYFLVRYRPNSRERNPLGFVFVAHKTAPLADRQAAAS